MQQRQPVDDQKEYVDSEQSERMARVKKEVRSSPEQTPVTSPPASKRWHMAINGATAPFADPSRTEAALAGLDDLLAKPKAGAKSPSATRKADVRFSSVTGLVRSLWGELYPEQTATTTDDMLNISVEFVQQHEKALLGTSGYGWLHENPATIGHCARLRQAVGDIPVYRGTASFGFGANGLLDVVNCSGYPIPLDIAYGDYFRLPWEQACEIAREHVAKQLLELEEQGESTPPITGTSDLEVIPGDDLKKGQVIFPHLDEKKGGTKNLYRPAWVARVIDRAQSQSWEVVIDAENGQVLAAAEVTAGATIHACVHPSNEQALAGTAEPRDLGESGSGKLADAPHFEMKGDAFAEPPPPGDCQTAIPTNDGFRSANVYYHLCHALKTFTKIGENAWPQAPEAPTMPGAEKRVVVNMCRSTASGQYDPSTRSILFGRADSGSSLPEPSFPKEDPTLDCEVIYHEYTHAVFHVVQPDIINASTSLFRGAIDEGGAFYFGCTLSERGQPGQPLLTQPYRWGEFARRRSIWQGFRDLQRESPNEQKSEYDYLPVYGTFPDYPGGCKDPDKEKYACGMLWARTLWDIRQALGHDMADAIILRGLSLTGGVQSELETPAEAIIHADRELAQGNPIHESALRLIFCTRGIMADSPVHDLVKIELGGKTYILAATENTSQSNLHPGCMFSDNDGDNWAPLGTDGPTEVAALAVAKISETKAVVWAAGERRTESQSSSTPTAKIYHYDLEVNTSGDIDTDNAWVELEDLPEKLDVLSLTAIKDPNGANDKCWLFAGTERGLYKYDGNWHKKLHFPYPIFGLEIKEQPSQCLLVASEDGPSILDPATMDPITKYNPGRPHDLTLTVVTGPAGGDQLWAGTAYAGVFEFDPNEKKWNQDKTMNRPVFRLLAEKQNAEWVLYAGTNNGVYTRTGDGDWNELNQVSSSSAEAIERTSVTSLCRVQDKLFAGTAQRGLWRRKVNWTRLVNGLPRLGRLIDAAAPTNTCNWSHPFTNDLPEHGVDTHVLYVPRSDCNTLSFTIEDGDVELALFYVSPYTDIDNGLWAGLQSRQLDANGGMVGQVQHGFYLLATTAGDQETSYRILTQLS